MMVERNSVFSSRRGYSNTLNEKVYFRPERGTLILELRGCAAQQGVLFLVKSMRQGVPFRRRFCN